MLPAIELYFTASLRAIRYVFQLHFLPIFLRQNRQWGEHLTILTRVETNKCFTRDVSGQSSSYSVLSTVISFHLYLVLPIGLFHGIFRTIVL